MSHVGKKTPLADLLSLNGRIGMPLVVRTHLKRFGVRFLRRPAEYFGKILKRSQMRVAFVIQGLRHFIIGVIVVLRVLFPIGLKSGHNLSFCYFNRLPDEKGEEMRRLRVRQGL